MLLYGWAEEVQNTGTFYWANFYVILMVFVTHAIFQRVKIDSEVTQKSNNTLNTNYPKIKYTPY